LIFPCFISLITIKSHSYKQLIVNNSASAFSLLKCSIDPATASAEGKNEDCLGFFSQQIRFFKPTL